jgi:DNA topoisomerase VI subunit B
MNNYKTVNNKSKSQKRKELVQSFLLYNFLNLSEKEKDEFFDKQVPEVIYRTMKLEGEKITRREVKKILKSH